MMEDNKRENNNPESIKNPSFGEGNRVGVEEHKAEFSVRMAVRDYECDIEGIVNNANYLHYLEHTRHLFLKQCGLSFAEMHRKGIDAVVARMTLQYKVPLRCDDEFISRLHITKEGIRYVFHQDILRADDNKISLRAKVELVCLVNGKLGQSPEYDEAFKEYIE